MGGKYYCKKNTESKRKHTISKGKSDSFTEYSHKKYAISLVVFVNNMV